MSNWIWIHRRHSNRRQLQRDSSIRNSSHRINWRQLRFRCHSIRIFMYPIRRNLHRRQRAVLGRLLQRQSYHRFYRLRFWVISTCSQTQWIWQGSCITRYTSMWDIPRMSLISIHSSRISSSRLSRINSRITSILITCRNHRRCSLRMVLSCISCQQLGRV